MTCGRIISSRLARVRRNGSLGLGSRTSIKNLAYSAAVAERPPAAPYRAAVIGVAPGLSIAFPSWSWGAAMCCDGVCQTYPLEDIPNGLRRLALRYASISVAQTVRPSNNVSQVVRADATREMGDDQLQIAVPLAGVFPP